MKSANHVRRKEHLKPTGADGYARHQEGTDFDQVTSRERVVAHGEVMTADREVTAMLRLVAHEAERIESRFLEPACGNGNFLAEVLRRKLETVRRRYGANQLAYERYSVLAVTSIYGIDLLEDNVRNCRKRLLRIYAEAYEELFPETIRDACLRSVRFILKKNIIRGDALTLKTVGKNPQPITFCEWSPLNGSHLKRRDFTFRSLLDRQSMIELPLFSDLGENVFIPDPKADYPATHFLEVGDV